MSEETDKPQSKEDETAPVAADIPPITALLQETLAADTVDSGQTLMNVLAQKEARELLASSKSYF